MEQFVRHTLARAEEVGNRRAQALCYHALGAVQYLTGRWPESATALQRSIDLASSVGADFGEVLGEQRLSLLETGLGQYEAADERLRRVLEQAQASTNPLVHFHSLTRLLATLARNRLEAGDLTSAAAYLEQGFAAQREVIELSGEDCVTCAVILYPVAVSVFLALDDLDRAEQACRRAEEVAHAFHSQAWMATARYLRGLLAAAHQDWQQAAACIEGALTEFQELGQSYDVARSLEALAGLAAKAGPALAHVRGDECQRQAAEIYTRLGAHGDARRLEGGWGT